MLEPMRLLKAAAVVLAAGLAAVACRSSNAARPTAAPTPLPTQTPTVSREPGRAGSDGLTVRYRVGDSVQTVHVEDFPR